MGSGMLQSLLSMAIRKDGEGRPQIAHVSPAAAIAGGEFQIRGKGFARSARPRVSFGEAEGVAESRSSWIRFDDAHSVIEPRFVVVGWSALGRLLLVITSNGGPRPRIISAQRATKREIDAYARR